MFFVVFLVPRIVWVQSARAEELVPPSTIIWFKIQAQLTKKKVKKVKENVRFDQATAELHAMQSTIFGSKFYTFIPAI